MINRFCLTGLDTLQALRTSSALKTAFSLSDHILFSQTEDFIKILLSSKGETAIGLFDTHP
jgi:hypothetical protein